MREGPCDNVKVYKTKDVPHWHSIPGLTGAFTNEVTHWRLLNGKEILVSHVHSKFYTALFGNHHTEETEIKLELDRTI